MVFLSVCLVPKHKIPGLFWISMCVTVCSHCTQKCKTRTRRAEQTLPSPSKLGPLSPHRRGSQPGPKQHQLLQPGRPGRCSGRAATPRGQRLSSQKPGHTQTEQRGGYLKCAPALPPLCGIFQFVNAASQPHLWS